MTATPTVSSGSEPQGARFRLQRRIVLPVVAAALFSTGVATWVGVRVTSQALRSRLEAQLSSAAIAVTTSDFAVNPGILRNIRLVSGVDVVTIGPAGEVLASSLTDDNVVAAARRVVGASPSSRVVDEECGHPCLMTARAVSGRPGTTAVVVADASQLTAVTQAVVRTMFVSAATSVLLLLLISQAVVKRVTRPLERLVTFVRGLGSEPGSTRAAVGNDEIGALAAAFNGLLDRLEQSRAALVRSEKLGLAGMFAARVAHDVRNPLSSIRMQTQLLQAKTVPGTEDRAVLSDMLRDVDQVESVIRDLMELANPGQLRKAPATLNDVVDAALDQLSHQLSHRKVTVERRLADALPPVPLDQARFKQALVNVLVNASEAMHTGGAITVSTGSDGPATLWVRICDDGVGVPPELLSRVFDPFVSTKPEGVGLGLVNVKAVVEGHGGRIALEPRAPRGTCALIHLPVSAGG